MGFENLKKVSSYNIASEASYFYILRRQKFVKNAKNSQFWKPYAYGQTVLLDRSILKGQKLMKSENIKCIF